MLLDCSLEDVLKKLEDPELILNETLIPADAPEVHHSPYRNGYDWLFWYERKLAGFLEPWLKEYRYDLIGEKGILCEALSNSFCHGHNRESKLPISIKVYLGQRGVLVQIKDSGNGFAVDKIKKNFRFGKPYFHLAGNGLRRMARSAHFGIFYCSKGNTFHLVYYFDSTSDIDMACK